MVGAAAWGEGARFTTRFCGLMGVNLRVTFDSSPKVPCHEFAHWFTLQDCTHVRVTVADAAENTAVDW